MLFELISPRQTQEQSPGSTSNIVADELDVAQRNLDGTLIRHSHNGIMKILMILMICVKGFVGR